jgi:hypothetical protein
VAGLDDRLLVARRDVVAVEVDVDVAERQLRVEQVLDETMQPAGEDRSARWIPTMARRSASAFFSTISCAIRTSVRLMSSRSRTTFSASKTSSLASLDPRPASRDRLVGALGW